MGTCHDPFLSILRVKFGLTCWRQQMGTWHRWHWLQSQLSSRPHNAKWSEMIRNDPKWSEMCIASAQKKAGTTVENNNFLMFPIASWYSLHLRCCRFLGVGFIESFLRFEDTGNGSMEGESHGEKLQALQALVWHLKFAGPTSKKPQRRPTCFEHFASRSRASLNFDTTHGHLLCSSEIGWNTEMMVTICHILSHTVWQFLMSASYCLACRAGLPDPWHISTKLEFASRISPAKQMSSWSGCSPS